MPCLVKKRLRWKPPGSPDLEGYRLYWSLEGRPHHGCPFADIGKRTEIILPDDIPSFPRIEEEIYVGVSALSLTGNESDISSLSTPVTLLERGPWEEFGIRRVPLSQKGLGPPWVTASIVSAIFVLFAVVLFFSRTQANLPPTASAPLLPQAVEPLETLRQLNLTMDVALSEKMVPHGDLHLAGIQEQERVGKPFTRLLMRCSERKSALEGVRRLTNAVSIMTADLTLLADEDRERGRIVCRIFMDGSEIYEVVLAYPLPPALPPDVRPRIAIILDDLGYNSHLALAFMDLGLPLTLSVLPSAPFTKWVAAQARRKGCELMLHLPMEPKQYPSIRPGPGALLVGMADQEIRNRLKEDLDQVAGVQGVNNHMGSRFTEDREKMAIVLRELKKKGLFYVDSCTTPNTIGFGLARQMGVPAARRNIFLDNDLGQTALRRQMNHLLEMAKHSGEAIAIIHPHEQTLRVLEDYLPKLKKEFHLVPASRLAG